MPRLFIALELPEDLKTRLSTVLASLRRRAPSAKWVDAKNMHVTLDFLGDMPEDAVPALQKQIQEACLRHPVHTPEVREFIPHLTLARSRKMGGDMQLAECASAAPPLQAALTVSAITLFESRLLPQGAEHVVRAECALSP